MGNNMEKEYKQQAHIFEKRLLLRDISKIEKFSLNGIKTYGYVESVYDGDTCKIIMEHNNMFNLWNCRINGVDTPELRTKCEEEKKYGKYVRDKLRDLLCLWRI
jgi:endonuclease YncB( thermonuclease family)